MFTFFGKGQRFCDGMSRRSFLRVGAFGAGLTLAGMLRAQAQSPTSTPKKSAIMIYLPGGPSHIDMYDMKPDAPAEFRGEFKPINTCVSGIQICEHFPLQAKMFDKLAIIRSLVAVDEHSDAQVMTGYSENTNRTAHHPSFGAVMSKVRGNTNNDVPPFVSLRGMSPGTEPGFLGVAHRPFTPDGPGLSNLHLPGGVNGERVEDRKSLLTSFDNVRREIDATGTMKGIDSFANGAGSHHVEGASGKALPLAPSTWWLPAPFAKHWTSAKKTRDRATATRASSSS